MAQVNLGHVVGHGVPTGGTANQVLVKNGTTNFDTSWKNASQLPAIVDEAAAREADDAALANGLAIIANGDTHAAVASGQAVFVRSHGTLAPGLYWASSAIGTNAALSTSNLTADASGGLNKLKGDIDSLNSNFSSEASGSTSVTNATRTLLLTKAIPSTGLYLIVRGVDWDNNANGVRGLYSDSSGSARISYVSQQAANGLDTVQQIVTLEQHSSGDNVYVYGIQSSGSALSAYPYLFFVKLK